MAKTKSKKSTPCKTSLKTDTLYNSIVREKIRRHNLRYALMCGVCLEIIKFQIIQKACQMWNW